MAIQRPSISISVVDKYGETAITINSQGVTQYSHFVSDTASPYGVAITEQTSVTDSTYYYDLLGRLLKVEQREIVDFTQNTSTGTQTFYLPAYIEYEYGYTFDSEGEIDSATAIGKFMGTSPVHRQQEFDKDMRLLKVYEYLEMTDTDGNYIGDSWQLAQNYDYYDFPDGYLYQNGTFSDIIDALGLTTGSIDAVTTSPATITINGVTYDVDPSTVSITDENGNSTSWSDLVSLFATDSNLQASVTVEDGEATEITLVTNSGSVEQAIDLDDHTVDSVTTGSSVQINTITIKCTTLVLIPIRS
jgi:hypothetical protein